MTTTRDMYMRELEQLLLSIPEHIRKEWLYDYAMHFQQAAENGQSEEEAAQELGDPRQIAGELLLNYRVEQAETKKSFNGLSRAVFATFSLGLFNIIFVIGPYLAVASVLLALWAVVLGLAVGGIAFIIEYVWFGNFTFVQGIAMGLIAGSLSILLGLGLKELTRLFFSATLKYLKFNTRIIRGKSN